ncbi:MAG: hypothetical protein H7A35_04890 [Planctomycetales bacterium]|nr:hypothetical protein [bacterium]UNM09394.1 MAG: hypothetical protein H7A35_04890 [Planctomycetales bacterium]
MMRRLCSFLCVAFLGFASIFTGCKENDQEPLDVIESYSIPRTDLLWGVLNSTDYVPFKGEYPEHWPAEVTILDDSIVNFDGQISEKKQDDSQFNLYLIAMLTPMDRKHVEKHYAKQFGKLGYRKQREEKVHQGSGTFTALEYHTSTREEYARVAIFDVQSLPGYVFVMVRIWYNRAE